MSGADLWKERLEQSQQALSRMLDSSVRRQQAAKLWEAYRKPTIISIGLLLFFASLLTLPLFSPGDPTGFATRWIERNRTLEISQTITESTAIPLEMNAAESFYLSGRIVNDGEVTILLETGAGRLLVYNRSASNASGRDLLIFGNVCGEACDLVGSPSRLLVRVGGGAIVRLDEATYTVVTLNHPPRQLVTLPNLELKPGETHTIALGLHFGDEDADELLYDVSEAEGVETYIDDGVLAITPQHPGRYDLFVYATDLEEMILSNVFEIRVAGAQSPRELGAEADDGTDGAPDGPRQARLKRAQLTPKGCIECNLTLVGAARRPEAAARFTNADGSNATLMIEGRRYQLEISPEDSPIRQIRFEDVLYREDLTVGIDVIEASLEGRPYLQSYAIDPTQANFTNATVSAVARGHDLYKCAAYNFTTQVCEGEWVWQRSLTPGMAYSFTLTPQDPAYGESDSETEPDYAYADTTGTGGDNGVVTSDVQDRADSNVVAVSTLGAGQNSFVTINWTNAFTNEAPQSIEAIFRWGGPGITKSSGQNVSVQWWTGSAWSALCTDSDVTAGVGMAYAYENFTCDLSSSVDTLSELNDVRIRTEWQHKTSNGGAVSGSEFDYAWLNITTNEYPKVNSVSVTPASPKVNDSLTCNYNVSDAEDDDVVVTIRWYRDQGTSSWTIDPRFTEKREITSSDFDQTLTSHQPLRNIWTANGEAWKCEVRVEDANGGREANASSVTVANLSASVAASATSGQDANEMVNFTATFEGLGGISLGRLYANISFADDVWDVKFLDIYGEGKQAGLVAQLYADELRGYNSSAQEVFALNGTAGLVYYRGLEVSDFFHTGYLEGFSGMDAADDFAIINATGSRIDYFDAYGTFTTALADLDRSGYRDDVVGVDNAQIWSYKTTDGSSWSEGGNYSGSFNAQNEIIAADILDDPGEEIIVLENNGLLLVFNATMDLQWSRSGVFGGAITLADLDHDGELDELVYDGASFNIYAVDADNNTLWTLGRGGSATYELVAGDFDGDGFYDDIIYGYSGGIRAINNESSTIWTYSDPSDVVDSMLVVDIDNDGRDEVIWGGDDNVLYINDDDGTLLWSETYANEIGRIGTTHSDQNRGVDIGDWDGDGLAEYLVAPTSSSHTDILVYGWVDYCEIEFSDLSANMTWNSTSEQWEYNRSFASTGTYDYNVTCSKPGYTLARNETNVTISAASNAAPEVTTPSLTPTTPVASDDLNCSFTINDSDTSSGLKANVTWYRNDSAYLEVQVDVTNATPTEHVLASGNTSVGENWTCEVVPYDGTDWGTGKNSSTRDVIAPRVQNIAIASNESTNHTNEPLNCSADLIDDDGDAMNVTMRWYKNGVLEYTRYDNTSIANGTKVSFILGEGNTTTGSVWMCSMRATDGSGTDPWLNSSTLTIAEYATSLNIFDEESDAESQSQSSDDRVHANEWTYFYANYTSDDGYDLGQALWVSSYNGNSGWSVRAIDADADGKRDEMAYNYWGVLRAFDVDGTSLWTASDSAYDNAMGLESGDFNGDGEDEVAMLAEGGKLYIFNATSGVELFSSGAIGSGYRGTFAMTSGDVDSDGNRDDIVVAGDEIGGTWGIGVYIYNETSGQYENYWNASDTGGQQVYEIDISELDGKENLIGIATESGGKVIVYYGNGSMKWETADLGAMYSLAFVDLDSDGDADEVVAGETSQMLFLNDDGSTNFSDTSVYVLESEILPYDSDNDGTDDGVLIGDSAHQIRAFDYDGNERWYARAPMRDFETWWEDGDYVSMRLADVNDDGRKELIAGQEGPAMFIFNTSDGSLISRYYIGRETSWVKANLYGFGGMWGESIGIDIVDDVNGDGIDDIIYARGEGYPGFAQEVMCTISLNGEKNYMWYNDSSDLWEYRYRFNETPFNLSVVDNRTYDWNVTCSKGGYESKSSAVSAVNIYLRNRTFEAFDQEDDTENKAGWLFEHQAYANETTYFFANYTDPVTNRSINGVGLDFSWVKYPEVFYTATFLDTDGDGDDDRIAFGGWEDIYVYFLNGTLNWSVQDTNLDTCDVHAADMDGDGKQELVVQGSGGYLEVYNATSGSELYSAGDFGSGSAAVYVADVDGDGADDVLASYSSVDSSYGFIVYHYNQTAGTYAILFNQTDVPNYVAEFDVAEFSGQQNLISVMAVGGNNVRVYYANGSLSWNSGSLGWAAWSNGFFDYDKDGVRDELIAGGSADNYIYDENGSLLDTHTAPDRPVSDLVPYDYDDDGYADEYVQFEQFEIRMLDSDGSELWSETLGANYYGSLRTKDINGDGREEILLLGAHDAILHVYNATGSKLREVSVMQPESLTENEIGQTGAALAHRGTGRGFDVGESGGITYVATAAYAAGGALYKATPYCRIDFDDDVSAIMSYNASEGLYYYARNFSQNGTFYWNVTCRAQDYANGSSTQETIFIPAKPDCGDVSSDMTLQDNISVDGATCITIDADDITIDCAGWWIWGNDTSGTSGINLNGHDNVTIRDCGIRNFYSGVAFASNPGNNTLLNLTTSSNHYGLDMPNNADENTIRNYTSINDEYGVYLAGSEPDANNFTNIDIQGGPNASYGIYIQGGENNTFRILSINVSELSGADAIYEVTEGSQGNSYDCAGGRIEGTTEGTTYGLLSIGDDTTITRCHIEGFDRGLVLYDRDVASHINISSGASGYGIYISSQENITLTNVSASDGDRGIYTATVNNLVVENSTFASNQYGIYLQTTNTSRLQGITLRENTGYAVQFQSTDNTNLTDFVVDGDSQTDRGIYLRVGSTNNRFVNFSITIASGSYYGIYIDGVNEDDNYLNCSGGSITGQDSGGSYGIYIDESDNTTVADCDITDFANGIRIDNGAENGTFTDLNITSSGVRAFYVVDGSSTGNTIEDTRMCDSSGADDAYDADSNTWTDNTCDTEGSNVWCVYNCDGTPKHGPSVESVSITPSDPVDNQALNCSFTLSDPDDASLWANVSWYRNSTYFLSANISASNDTQASAILGAGNISAGERWLCEVTPHDGAGASTASNSSSVYIYDNVTSCGTLYYHTKIESDIENYASTCFTIGSSDIDVLCQGHTIDGDDSASTYGFTSTDKGNITVEDCIVSDFAIAFFFTNTDNSTIKNTTTKSNVRGIRYSACMHNNVTNYNSSEDTNVGLIMFSSSQYNNFTDVDITLASASTTNAIRLGEGANTNNRFVDVNVDASAAGAHGIFFLDSETQNTDNFVDCRGGTILGGDDAGVHGVYWSQSSNTLTNCTITDFDSGVRLGDGSDHTNVSDIAITSSRSAITLENAVNNTFERITLTENTQSGINVTSSSEQNNFTTISIAGGSETDYGIFVSGATNNRFVGIKINVSGSDHYAIREQQSNNNGENLFDCQGGLIDGDDSSGSRGYSSSGSANDTLRNCTFQDFERGIRLDSDDAANISDIRISSSTYGVDIDYASNDNAITDLEVESATYGLRMSSDAGGLRVVGFNASIVGAGRAIVVDDDGADDVSINCLNRTLSGDDTAGSYGAHISDADNVTLRNCTIVDFGSGLHFREQFGESIRHTIEKLNISSSVSVGVNVSSSTVNSSTFTSNRICDSGGSVDVYDADTNAWSSNYCDATDGWAWCDYDCSGASNANTPPQVDSVSLGPSPAVTSDDLNCTFTLTDSEQEELRANVTWYRNDTAYSTVKVTATNDTPTWTGLDSAITELDESWKCEVLPYDPVESGSAQNSSALTIEQGCGEITDDVTLSKDLTTDSTCFQIKASDVTIDCAGYSVTGSGGTTTRAIEALGGSYDAITIKRCEVVGFGDGAYLTGDAHNITRSNFSGQSLDAVYILNSQDGHLSDVRATNMDDDGIHLESSDNYTLSRLNLEVGSGYGLWLDEDSDQNLIEDFWANTTDSGVATIVRLGGITATADGTRIINMTLQGHNSGAQFTYAISSYIINTSDLYVDCEGSTIEDGDIYLEGKNMTVRNCRLINSSISTFPAGSGNSSGLLVENIVAQGAKSTLLGLDALRDSIIRNVSVTDLRGQWLIDLDMGSSNNTISNITMVGEDATAIQFSDDDEPVVNNSILDFNISIANGTAINISVDAHDENFIDCRGRRIVGDDTAGTYGALIASADKTTITDCTFKDFGVGVMISSTSTDHNLTDLNISSSVDLGLNISDAASTSSTFSSNRVCDSGGSYDIYDTDSNSWYDNVCDDRGGGADCKYYCDGSIQNQAPQASDVNLTPTSPYDTDDLNCTFTITDSDPFDTLYANVTWYNGSSAVLTRQIAVTNNTPADAVLGAGNLSGGEDWLCEVTPYDSYEYGSGQNTTSRHVWENVTACGTIYGDARLTDDISTGSGDCIDIGASSIALECRGFSMTGGGDGNGVDFNGYDYVNLSECATISFDKGYDLDSGATYNTIINSNASLSTIGLYIWEDDNVIENMTVADVAEQGIVFISTATGNNLSGITVRNISSDGGLDTYAGIHFSGADGNRIEGVSVNVSGNNNVGILVDNAANNNYIHCRGGTIDRLDSSSSTTGIYVGQDIDLGGSASVGNEIHDCIFKDLDHALELDTAQQTDIDNLTFKGPTYAVYAVQAASTANNRLSNLDVINATTYALYVVADSNNFTNVTIDHGAGSQYPVYLSNADANRFVNLSVLAGDETAIRIQSNAIGNYFDCRGGRLSGDDTASTYGAYLDGDSTSLVNCTFEDFDYGIFMTSNSVNNTILRSNVSSSVTGGIRIDNAASTGSTIANSSFCGSGGSYDAYDGDANTWTNVSCDTMSPAGLCYLNCSGGVNNEAPVVQSVNVTPIAPNTTSDLVCTINITDDGQTETLLANYTWYRDGEANETGSDAVTSGQEHTVTLGSSNTSKGESWHCNVTAYDGSLASDENKSNVVTIKNSPPAVPTLLYPADDNHSVFERIVNLNWTSSDDDGDAITYNLSLEQDYCADDVQSGLATANHTTGELCVDRVYNWTVQACDEQNCSEWAQDFNFTVASTIILSLSNPQVDFGSLSPTQNDDTADETPSPFIVTNDGNVIADIDVKAKVSLWSSEALDTDYFQFRADNATEEGSFLWSYSATEWTNVSDTDTLVLKNLSYLDANDVGEVEFRIEVPFNEPPGEKSTDVYIIGEMPLP